MVRAGAGPPLVLVHGSAADHTTWSIQLASALRDQFTLVAYDRRGDATSVEAHADDLAAVIADAPGRAIVVGSSFGAVVALELVRTRLAACAGAVLIEPPMAATDARATTQAAFVDRFDREVVARGGPAAGELFLRTAVGDAAVERMPRALRARAAGRWREIRADVAALAAYRPRYAELGELSTPMLLLGGDRSAPYFRPTLDALAASLPAARLEIVRGAGHMLHAEAPKRFAELVRGFAGELGVV